MALLILYHNIYINKTKCKKSKLKARFVIHFFKVSIVCYTMFCRKDISTLDMCILAA